MGLKKLRRRLWRLYHDLTVRCNVCQGRAIERFVPPATAPREFHFRRCRDCGLVFVVPEVQTDPVEQYAQASIPDLGEEEGTWNRHNLEALHEHVPGRGRLLELGFGNGSFLEMAQEAGWEVHGADLSEPLVQRAREDLRLPNIELGTVEQVGYPDEHFDVVAGFNFLEHVPDPRATLVEIRRILKPGGLAAVLCPNLGSLYHRLMLELLGDRDPLCISWVPPAHLYYFNKENLARLLREVGYEVVADESRRMTVLWHQHEAMLGPEATSRKLEALLAQTPGTGEQRIQAMWPQLRTAIAQRMTWEMITSIMDMEEKLGAESSLLYLARRI